MGGHFPAEARRRGNGTPSRTVQDAPAPSRTKTHILMVEAYLTVRG